MPESMLLYVEMVIFIGMLVHLVWFGPLVYLKQLVQSMMDNPCGSIPHNLVFVFLIDNNRCFACLLTSFALSSTIYETLQEEFRTIPTISNNTI